MIATCGSPTTLRTPTVLLNCEACRIPADRSAARPAWTDLHRGRHLCSRSTCYRHHPGFLELGSTGPTALRWTLLEMCGSPTRATTALLFSSGPAALRMAVER